MKNPYAIYIVNPKTYLRSSHQKSRIGFRTIQLVYVVWTYVNFYVTFEILIAHEQN